MSSAIDKTGCGGGTGSSEMNRSHRRSRPCWCWRSPAGRPSTARRATRRPRSIARRPPPPGRPRGGGVGSRASVDVEIACFLGADVELQVIRGLAQDAHGAGLPDDDVRLAGREPRDPGIGPGADPARIDVRIQKTVVVVRHRPPYPVSKLLTPRRAMLTDGSPHGVEVSARVISKMKELIPPPHSAECSCRWRPRRRGASRRPRSRHRRCRNRGSLEQRLGRGPSGVGRQRNTRAARHSVGLHPEGVVPMGMAHNCDRLRTY